MIRVTFLREQGRLVGFDCKGHADYAEQGQDIVCSAVSVLAQTTVLGLVQVAHIPAGYAIEEDGGLHCILGRDATGEQCKEAELLLKTLSAGLHAVDESYPGYLKFVSKEV